MLNLFLFLFLLLVTVWFIMQNGHTVHAFSLYHSAFCNNIYYKLRLEHYFCGWSDYNKCSRISNTGM